MEHGIDYKKKNIRLFTDMTVKATWHGLWEEEYKAVDSHNKHFMA